MDRLYYMAGVNLPISNRYATDEEALKRMQALAQEARMLQMKNNTPCDSLPKLNQEPSDLVQDSAVNGEPESNGAKEKEGENDRNPSGVNLSSAENQDSFFITQNGVEDHPSKSKEKEIVDTELPNDEANAQQNNTTEPSSNGQNDEGRTSTENPDNEEPTNASNSRVRERRFLLFGSEERPNRSKPLLSRRSSLLVQSMYNNFKQSESSKNEELEDIEGSDENSSEDEDDLSIDDVSSKMQALLRRRGSKKLNYDRSVFSEKEGIGSVEEYEQGVKYTSSVHKQEEKKEEFRKVTRHLVVKQEESILYVEANMDEEQAEIFSKMFNDIDKNNEGRIGLEELQMTLFSHLKVADLPHFLRVFDLNNDRKIDRREFMAVAGLNDRLCKQRTTNIDGNWNVDLEKLSYYITVYKEMFSAVDMDHDGRVSLEELMVIIAASLDEETGTDIALMEDILESIDKDNNGYIDFVEYLQYIPMFLQIHNYLMRKPMLIEDIERSRRVVRTALQHRGESESSDDNIWDE